MKKFVLIFICSLTIQYCYSQNYFVTDIEGRDQVLAISTGSNFGGIIAADNYNVLATILGDSPYTLLKPGQKLIDKVNLTMGDVNFDLQPLYLRETGNSRMRNLPPCQKLTQFLSDPLQGEKFDLTLPFIDGRVALSARSAFIRLGNDCPGTDYHTAIDFDRSDITKSFEIIAAADGIVLRNRQQVLVLAHTTPMGKIFLTIYQHLKPDSKSKLLEGMSIKRGDRIGTLQTGGYTHLHFAVAVLVHGGLVGNVLVPERYYLIDPLGVYEERKNSNDITLYNYLPKNNIGYRLSGVKAINVFRTNPINGSFFVGSFMPQENWTSTPFFGDKGTYFTDVDGDQKADAIAVNQAQPIKVCQSNGLSFDASSFWTDIPYLGDKGNYFADVTGDGMDDAIVVLQNNPVVVRRSDQDRFTSNENWTNIPYFGDKGTYFADVTGDGKSDAIVVRENHRVVVRRSHLQVMVSNLNEEWTDIPFFWK
ncbi:MAG: VCBS repeat domain-containing M23 family metallopeptidase [Saprospiraceae bacterium]|nr:VCBS repeat domain-containing M23 family metallopeptidase [Candidatus Defluviibacterium haderslevense]